MSKATPTSIFKRLPTPSGTKRDAADNAPSAPEPGGERKEHLHQALAEDDFRGQNGKDPERTIHQQPQEDRQERQQRRGSWPKRRRCLPWRAEMVAIIHQALHHCDPCPACEDGRVYCQGNPGVVVRIKGAAPLWGTVYELEKLRCNICGKIFTADLTLAYDSFRFVSRPQ